MSMWKKVFSEEMKGDDHKENLEVVEEEESLTPIIYLNAIA